MDGPFEPGETILLRGRERTIAVRLEGEMSRFVGAKGAIPTSSLVGRRPGDRVTVGTRDFVAIRPDVLDHLSNLERGPQTVISKDSAYMALHLGLSAGSRVLEAGAGSGCLTIALLNAVSPGGKVITYDNRQEHLELARRNVSRTPLAVCWEGRVGDIRDGVPDRDMDAIALDMPDPEAAVGALVGCLRPGGRICCYVPTANQVERAYLALEASGLSETRAVEIFERAMSVKPGATRPSTEMLGHTGYMVFARYLP